MEPYVTEKTIARKSKQWLAKIHLYNQHEMTLNPDKSALIVIDMQKFFLDAGSPTFTCGGPAILPTLKRVIGLYVRRDVRGFLHRMFTIPTILTAV